MNIIWIIYWVLILCSLIFGIFVIFKKNKVLGISQFVLSLVVPVIALLFTLNRPTGVDEFPFLYKEFLNGNVMVYLIFILYLVLISLFIYNIFSFRKKKNLGEDDERRRKDD